MLSRRRSISTLAVLTNVSVNYLTEALRFFASLRFSQNDNYLFLPFPFYLFTCLPAGGRKGAPPIIGATCAFDAKIYKNVDAVLAVSPCLE